MTDFTLVGGRRPRVQDYNQTQTNVINFSRFVRPRILKHERNIAHQQHSETAGLHNIMEDVVFIFSEYISADDYRIYLRAAGE